MYDLGNSGEMNLLASAAAGMRAQRTVLDVAARNVAAAQSATPGHPYSRLVAQFDPVADASDDDGFARDESGDAAGDDAPALQLRAQAGTGDALTEMIAVLDAQRAYEQNASIFDTAKRLAERTIDIGRG